MNPFISLQEFSYQSQDSFILIFCSSSPTPPTKFIPRSFFYVVDDNAAVFTKNCSCLEIDDDKTIICYDNGDLHSACKACWGFKATGHDDVKVLLGGIKSCDKHRINLVSGEIPEIKKGETPCLPFNEAVAMTLEQFSRKESYAEQVIEAKRLNIEITDAGGEILSQTLIVKLLKENEIEYKPNKMTIVHGKNAFYVGLILNYLGERMISVVLEDTTGFVSAKKSRLAPEYKKPEKVTSIDPQVNRKCCGCSVF
ncbi:hypothetical protein SteCoe_7700 [Stentor coeruleus]|uniref:Rhodanese domain-containing protein n=1 Tax=Stentor coeruleus TaxID=5963 RepID=A0A1R2CM04_9CILI|nr:hypothetical protein SteCoe_7700 [Stentor coeruleus]